MNPENGEMDCNGLSTDYKNDSCFITQCQGIYIHLLVLILTIIWTKLQNCKQKALKTNNIFLIVKFRR